MKDKILDRDFLQKNLTIDGVLDAISKLENPLATDDAGPVKWKSFNNQVVVESERYFYKVYEEFTDGVGPFNSLVRNFLADEYARLGIDWKIITFERDGKIFDFEQRQKLRVLEGNDMSFEEVLLSFSEIIGEVEKSLEFKSILEQLETNEAFENVEQLKLIRYCVNKFADYAVFDNHVVLLDDADWIITLVDCDGEPVLVDPDMSVPVKTSNGAFLFTQALFSTVVDGKKKLVVPEFNQCTHGWYLLTENEQEKNCDSLAVLKKDEKEFVDSVTKSVESSIAARVASLCNEKTLFVDDKETFEIEARLVDEDETKTYFSISQLLSERRSVVLKTRLPEHSFERSKWENHMKNISICFPQVMFRTEICLTDHLCESWLQGNFDPFSTASQFSSTVYFTFGDKSSLNRDAFRKFLIQIAKNKQDVFLSIYECCPKDFGFRSIDDMKQIWTSVTGETLE